MHIIVVTGRSGSGKSSALDLLEDEGFTCIDNLPVSLLPALLKQLRERADAATQKLAIGIDARNIDSDLNALPPLLDEAKNDSDQFHLLYLDSSRDTLIKRFSETRRKHPLTNSDTGLNEAISEEDSILEPLADLADTTIDSTRLSLHELRSAVKARVIGDKGNGVAVMLTSFGFKFGVPVDADFVFDVRCLPNPYWDANLRGKSGRTPEVQTFLDTAEQVQSMRTDLLVFINKWIPAFEENNRSYLTIAIGCTGGMHRSVYLTEKLYQSLRESHKSVQLRHRELEKIKQ